MIIFTSKFFLFISGQANRPKKLNGIKSLKTNMQAIYFCVFVLDDVVVVVDETVCFYDDILKPSLFP